MTSGALAGRQFMFDYGEIAKFLPHFSRDGAVEVTALAGIVYSVTHEQSFPVEVAETAAGRFKIRWRDVAEQTDFTHSVDFDRGRSVLVIEDRGLRQTRRYEGQVSSA